MDALTWLSPVMVWLLVALWIVVAAIITGASVGIVAFVDYVFGWVEYLIYYFSPEDRS